MEEVYRKGYVYIQEKFAGIIEETEDGYRFCYEDNYFSDENSVYVVQSRLLMHPQKKKERVGILDV